MRSGVKGRCVVSVAAMLGVAGGGTALAQSSGPDVVVGDISATTQFTNGGAVNGKRSYAIATTSCNVGTQPLAWVAGGNQHPVISQNLYRLLNGRFEQIGQAWLKHGFCALQGTVCGTCPTPLDCSALGVQCSDPYSAPLNGQQSGLGPKSQVNAATGEFPYPFDPGSGSGVLFKRLQAEQADLAIPGALYFVASMYVQPEDAAAHNNDNNESYRRVTVDPATYSLEVQDTTQTGRAAILAWADQDPGVTVSDIDVPGDGRFILAAKATDSGNGAWHYEYAIQNLNSDRSARAFMVPLPPGAAVSGVGFHDVDYHSGEPYDPADWDGALGSVEVTWSTAAYATSVNANALRWDTVYNFRFDSTAAPAAGIVTLALFKPGTPASVSAPTIVPVGGGGPLPPPNDNCADAQNVAAGSTPISTLNATTDGPDEPAACGASGATQIGADVWYRYTAPCAGTASVSLCGSAFDTRLAIYAAACPTTSSAIACNDDSPDCGAGSTGSAVTFAAGAGAVYSIRVGGFNGASGSGTMTITGPVCAPAPPPAPSNDACAGRIGLSLGTTPFSTVGATTDGPPDRLCNARGSDQIMGDIWYNYPSQCTGALTITTCNAADFDTRLAVYSGSGCNRLKQRLIACNDDATGGTGGAGCGRTSTLTFNVTAGLNYTIRVGGFSGATGTGSLSLSCSAPATAGCPADFNGSGRLESEDYFDYLGAFFDGLASADYNGDGAVGSQDFYAFLTDFFAGCPQPVLSVVDTP
jgi:hypothetical protein